MFDKLFFIGIAIFVVWAIVYARYPVRVTLASSGIRDAKNLPIALQSKLNSFARENIDGDELVKLKGHLTHRGRIRWVFPKKTEPSLPQRLRNFMVNEVYL